MINVQITSEERWMLCLEDKLGKRIDALEKSINKLGKVDVLTKRLEVAISQFNKLNRRESSQVINLNDRGYNNQVRLEDKLHNESKSIFNSTLGPDSLTFVIAIQLKIL